MLQKCIIDSALSKELQLQDNHVTLQNMVQRTRFPAVQSRRAK